MKVAICLSGQPREWKKCYPRWIDAISPAGEIDIFFHMWDYNTLPNMVAASDTSIGDEKLSEAEMQDIVTTMSPKKYIFESRKHIGYWNTDLPYEKQFGPWCAEQFYSIYYASLLKRQYEIEHEFRYDIVIRVRSDLWFIDMPPFEVPLPNTAYTTHCAWDDTFQCYRVGDIFYYADSHTYDQISEFYKFLSFVPTDWVTRTNTCPPPEIALYFYLANIGIVNHPTHTTMKIMRDKRVIDFKGQLEDYEVFE